ncbi:myosin tail region-interacting protein MTI1-like, partial [Teratosphaeria destructans]
GGRRRTDRPPRPPGLTADAPTPATPTDGGEEQPKPMSLKERMALLQKEQEAQRARHAEGAPRKKPPVKKPSESSERGAAGDGDEDPTQRGSSDRPRPSLDVLSRETPRLPSTQRRPTDPMSPQPVPEHEILSGGEEADQSAAGPECAPIEVDAEKGEGAGDEEEEEEELDEEEQRKQRLRERMARLAGGQQGGGPFNPFGMPPAAAPKKRSTRDKEAGAEELPSSPPRVPQMVAIPGMGGPRPRVQSARDEEPEIAEQMADGREPEPAPAPPRRSTTIERDQPPPVPRDVCLEKPCFVSRPGGRRLQSSSHLDMHARPVPQTPAERGVPPPVPNEGSRPVPRPPPAESRPVPPPPPAAAAPTSPGPGSESDDEMSFRVKRSSAEIDTPGPPTRSAAPPVPTQRDVPPPPGHANKRESYFGSEPSSTTSEKRTSRMPPPIPGVTSPNSPRPPPPPPPAAPSRQSTDLQPPDETQRGESDYEGDYDTDIASSVKHKDALKYHAREPSLDDSTTADELTPVTTPMQQQQQQSRAVPPPPPAQAPPRAGRPSMDAPRAAPPPVPPPQSRAVPGDDDEYDPFRHDTSAGAPPPVPGAVPLAAPPIPTEGEHDQSDADEDEEAPPAPPTRKSTDRAPPPPPSAAAPPMPPREISSQQPPLPTRMSTSTRQSLEVQRQPTIGRRSMEVGRPSGEFSGQIAQDLDLAPTPNHQWWTASNALPPVLQNRNGVDILTESEESQKSKRGGRMQISKDIYVLYMDYSQTVITASYDSTDPAGVTLEQRHEPPPPKLRQDQLESYWQKFGKAIASEASAAGNTKKDSVIGDGSPASLPLELIKKQKDALLPVGTRAYGALVYANLANASTQQFDEIRPGDIITVRNAKFEGHHGSLKTKYKTDYGVSHVGVVEEWDGTRRSVRAWEQGREKKGGVRSEKFRLGDLRSGEVRVWRVVGREWVGWDN